MEVHVVLAHELVQFDVVLVEPPPLPFRGVVGSDTWVADRCVELGPFSMQVAAYNSLLLTHTSAKYVNTNVKAHIRVTAPTQHLPLHPMVVLALHCRHRHTPRQVSCDGTRPEPRAHARVDDLALVVDNRVRRPLAQRPAALHPRLRLWLEHVEFHVHVRGGLGRDFVLPADEAAGVDEVDRVERPRADVALVAARVLVVRAGQKGPFSSGFNWGRTSAPQ